MSFPIPFSFHRPQLGYECPICDGVLADLAQAEVHAAGCTGEVVQYVCDACGITFLRPDECDAPMPTCSSATSEGPQWPSEKVSNLITEMESRYDRYIKMLASAKKVHWQEVAELIGVSAEAARLKWNSLLGTYRRTKDNAGPRASGRGKLTIWPYFGQLERIMEGNPSITPPYVATSMRGAEAQSDTTRTHPSASEGEGDAVSGRRKVARGRKSADALSEWTHQKAEIEERKATIYEKRTAVLERLAHQEAGPSRSTQRQGTVGQATLKELASVFKDKARDMMGATFSHEKMVKLFQLCLESDEDSD